MQLCISSSNTSFMPFLHIFKIVDCWFHIHIHMHAYACFFSRSLRYLIVDSSPATSSARFSSEIHSSVFAFTVLLVRIMIRNIQGDFLLVPPPKIIRMANSLPKQWKSEIKLYILLIDSLSLFIGPRYPWSDLWADYDEYSLFYFTWDFFTTSTLLGNFTTRPSSE